MHVLRMRWRKQRDYPPVLWNVYAYVFVWGQESIGMVSRDRGHGGATKWNEEDEGSMSGV